ncbi:CsgG/HfaB family protein [Candidatus Cyanaurora vandensis]|uniref:CsgG/HfaB family protein n=1 Tax=Candidatus Cyanaurora vandensis TaxID=2714958 RepID=UPI00257E7C36|nr:CsgG/HfaB family protein [Candidatus Cyanaurora vandensis]
MLRRTLVATWLCLFSLTPTLFAQGEATRRRIAVLDFDFSSLSNPYVVSFAGNGAGRAVSNFLVDKLVKDGTYIVLERTKLNQLLQEQNLAQGGRIQPGTEAQLGRLLGVDALIIGSINKFNIEERQSGGGFGLFGISTTTKETKAVVQVSARMVSTSTGEILATAEGEADQAQSDGSVSVMGIGGGSSANVSDSLLSNAANLALDKVSPQLIAAAPRLVTFLDTAVQATIADVTGREITINKGSEVGLKPGMTMRVERVTKEVKDPETGKVLRQITSPVGTITLTETSAGSAMGVVSQGKGFKVGDKAKLVTVTTTLTGTIKPQPAKPSTP